jgi:hypothetical protein
VRGAQDDVYMPKERYPAAENRPPVPPFARALDSKLAWPQYSYTSGRCDGQENPNALTSLKQVTLPTECVVIIIVAVANNNNNNNNKKFWEELIAYFP